MIRRILIVPGFCEPHWLLWPIRRALGRPDRPVDLWHDRRVFRKLDQSVEALRHELQSSTDADRTLGIVTHSFGDWVVRQAIAGLPHHKVAALVSVAPVLGESPVAQVLKRLGGSGISEVPVMADPIQASQNAILDPSIQRLLVWASLDLWVQTFEFTDTTSIEVHHVWATHLTVVLQPNVHCLIRSFFNRSDASQRSGSKLG